MTNFADQTEKGPSKTPRGTRIYAVGDVHGRADLLGQMLKMIEADLDASPIGTHQVVFLGDYLDRGADGAAVVQMLQAGPPPRLADGAWICLCGNHEDALLDFLEDVSCGPLWLSNGGWSTVESYVGNHIGNPADLVALQAQLRHKIPHAHRHFLKCLTLWHEAGDYLFVHAGLRPGVSLDDQDPSDLLWIRGPFLHSAFDFGKIIVHGHSIVSAPDVRANRIGIDTGACYSGRLTTLVLEGEERRFLTT
jgi:serine/threonine protein phosphatase 1